MLIDDNLQVIGFLALHESLLLIKTDNSLTTGKYSFQGVFAMLGPPLAGALVEAAGHRGPALQVHQIFLRIR